jgi:hypothetical protein
MIIAIAARVIVGAVLIYAAAAKLRTRTWPVLAVEMGVPKPVVLMLPAVEGIVGLALVLQIGAGWTAWIAAAMFMVFTAVVVRQFVSGNALPCNCFGAAGGEEAVNGYTIARNVALIALAFVGTL